MDIESTSTLKVKTENSSYWRINLSLILFPLIISGAPVHQLVLKKNDNIHSAKEWLRTFFIPISGRLYWICVPINIFLIIFAISVNLSILVYVFRFLKELFIDGVLIDTKLSIFDLFAEIINIFQFIPQIIIINILWIKGYQFKNLINSFDNDFEIINKLKIKLNYTLKLGGLYFLLIFSEVTQTIIIGKQNQYCNYFYWPHLPNNETFNEDDIQYIYNSDEHQLPDNETSVNNYIGSYVLCDEIGTLDILTHLIVEITYYLMLMLYIVISWVIIFNFNFK